MDTMHVKQAPSSDTDTPFVAVFRGASAPSSGAPHLAADTTDETINAAVEGVLSTLSSRPEEVSWWPPDTYMAPKTNEPLAPWTQFDRVQLNKPSFASRCARRKAAGLPDPTDDDSYIDECSAFMNSRYCVLIRDVPARAECPALWHVMIQRRDGQPPGPERYRDFMRIRDELVGDEHEALEMYPARSRETDMANVYHLWAMQSASDEFHIGFK